MPIVPSDSIAQLPLTPAVFYILLALADEERHGYGIMQEVAARTGGQIQLGPGTLYGTLKRLVTSGLVMETQNRSPGADAERRRYYCLTPRGQEVAIAEAGRLRDLVRVAIAKSLLPSAEGLI